MTISSRQIAIESVDICGQNLEFVQRIYVLKYNRSSCSSWINFGQFTINFLQKAGNFACAAAEVRKTSGKTHAFTDDGSNRLSSINNLSKIVLHNFYCLKCYFPVLAIAWQLLN